MVECILHFLSVEDALALACTSKCWRLAVNQDIFWRRIWRRDGEEDNPNDLRKEYRDYAMKYKDSSFDPLCESAFVLVYPRYMEKNWNDYINMRRDLEWEEESEETESI